MIAAFLLVFVPQAPPQDGTTQTPPPRIQGDATAPPAAATDAAAPDAGSAQVEALRERIHGMRMNLLLGGEKVRSAEKDATQFYRQKSELVDQRLDSLAAEITEARASYQLALEQALKSTAEDQRKNALHEAAELRQKVSTLEGEQAELGERRGHLEHMVEAVEARGRERQRLATKIESEPGDEEAMLTPLGDIGLAPELQELAPSSVLDDKGLVGDLLSRDPVAARRLLFASDPHGYWDLFPLRPPAAALRGALKFPPPDLPGQR